LDIIEGLIEHQINFVNIVHELLPEIITSTKSENPSLGVNDFSETNYKLPATCFALLYTLDHPKNILKGQEWVKDDAITLIEMFLDQLKKNEQGEWELTEINSEWLPYTVIRVTTILKDFISDDLKERAKAYVEIYADHGMHEPMFFTAFNHESWRCMYLYLAGETYGREDWKEASLFLMHQLLKCKTKENFWEESTHHGPSMKYNQLMLMPMAWLSKMSNDPLIEEAAKNLSEFMSTWTFPDGTTVGAFDGRQSTSLMMFSPVIPGLELHPQGATLNQRGIDLWNDHGHLSNKKYLGNSNWYAFFSSFNIADSLIYFSKYGLENIENSSLPIDEPQVKLINHSTEFNGMLIRDNDWVLATSSQNTDIPRAAHSVFRLERQSRLELWHKEYGVIIGGGHNVGGLSTPLANVVHTVNEDIECEFGYVEPSRARGGRKAKSLYICRAVSSEFKDGASELTQIFGNGTFHWVNKAIDDNHFEFSVEWELLNIQKLYLQLPLVLWRDQSLSINKKNIDGRDPGLTDKIESIKILNNDQKPIITVSIPEYGETRIRTGIRQLQSYGPLFEKEYFEPPYFINLISTQFINPEKNGKIKWEIKV